MNLLHRLRSGGWRKWTRWTGRERAQVKSTRLTGRETRPGGGLKWTRWTGREEEGRRFRRLCFALHRLAPFAPYNRNKRDSILYPSSLPFSFLPLSLSSFLPLSLSSFLPLFLSSYLLRFMFYGSALYGGNVSSFVNPVILLDLTLDLNGPFMRCTVREVV